MFTAVALTTTVTTCSKKKFHSTPLFQIKCLIYMYYQNHNQTKSSQQFFQMAKSTLSWQTIVKTHFLLLTSFGLKLRVMFVDQQINYLVSYSSSSFLLRFQWKVNLSKSLIYSKEESYSHSNDRQVGGKDKYRKMSGIFQFYSVTLRFLLRILLKLIRNYLFLSINYFKSLSYPVPTTTTPVYY